MKKLLTYLAGGAIMANLALTPLNAYGLSQDETVYAKLQPSGDLSALLVQGHLVNDLRDTKLFMKTRLTDVENLNGFENYTQESNGLIWSSEGRDIYYSGKTDQKLPINLQVTYQLNGEQKSLDEILGQSGKIELKIQYQNLSKVKDLYTPFVVAFATTLPATNVRNVEITNGKVIDNGKTVIVTAVAAPGLYDSLGYENLKKLDEIILTYETEKFELNDIYNFVTPKVLEDNDLKIFDSLDSLYSDAESLSQGSKELVHGSQQLRNGVQELRDGVVNAQTQLDHLGHFLDEQTLDSIAHAAATAAQDKVAEQKTLIRQEVHAQVSSLSNGLNVDQITSSIRANSAQVAQKYVTQMLQTYITENHLEASYTIISSGNAATLCADGSKPDCAGVAQIMNKQEELKGIAEGMIGETLAPVQSALGEVAASLNTSAIETKLFNTIYSNMRSVASQTASTTAQTVATQVAQSIETELSKKLSVMMSGVVGGIDQLLDGANKLNDGMISFDRDGIQTLNNFINQNVKSTSHRLKRLTQLADNYNNFGGLTDGAKGTTKFILMIEGKK